ncbi:cathepsin L-like [Euwallacea similis]|uniref:cathepsin L-like n=1 Tax=Euwallacea similis TaxID=1736056 RepID=UPI00344D4021
MKLVPLIALFYLNFCVSSSDFIYEKEWQAFKNLHNVSYRSRHHENSRRQIFEQNVHKIKAHNVLYEHGIKGYKLGISPFADLTSEEYKALLNLRNGERRTARSLFKIPENRSVIPKSIDWREKGAVTSIKDQGFCGSCWAFSAIGSVEGQYFLKYGKLLSFSEQQLIDCASEYGSKGCSGGLLNSGFQYIRDKGIEEEITYPYEMIDDVCQASTNLTITKIKDYVEIESLDEDALLAAVGIIGPVSVAIDASDFDLQFYKEGIYEGEVCSQTTLNHGVVIVGYGSAKGVDYWIVKNSWGGDFGVDGYIYMKRGVNQCGIAKEPVYAIF